MNEGDKFMIGGMLWTYEGRYQGLERFYKSGFEQMCLASAIWNSMVEKGVAVKVEPLPEPVVWEGRLIPSSTDLLEGYSGLTLDTGGFTMPMIPSWMANALGLKPGYYAKITAELVKRGEK